jgi:hypothetical protein
MDYDVGISKCGDVLLRTMLYEGAVRATLNVSGSAL